MTSPVGDDAARLAAIKISEGFNLGYCRAKPGCGPMMHNHDTNETFIPMTGTWRASWENESGEVEYVDLGAARSWCIASARHDPSLRERHQGRSEPGIRILMFVIGGDRAARRVHGSGDALSSRLPAFGRQNS